MVVTAENLIQKQYTSQLRWGSIYCLVNACLPLLGAGVVRYEPREGILECLQQQLQ